MTTPLPADDIKPRSLPLGVAASCPHCGTRAHIRTSRLLTETYREGWAICTNCGFKGKIHVAWDAEVTPSLQPNPRVALPKLAYRDAVEQFFTDSQAGKAQLDLFVSSG